MHFFRRLIVAAIMLGGFAGCSGTKQAVYFANDLTKDTTLRSGTLPAEAPTIIRPNDILAINVTSISSVKVDSDPVQPFRDGGTLFTSAPQSAINSGSAAAPGYLVDEDGFIDFPVLGKLKLGGLTLRQAKEELTRRLTPGYLKNPSVEIRIMNYKVVVLGEVARPGAVLVPNHQINVLEALGAAGDINVTGKKDRVLVIRQNGNQQEYARLNFNDRSVFQSPYFNLQQNDIVIVEPTQTRRQTANPFTQTYLPIITTVVTVGLTALAIILANSNNN